MKNVQPKGGLLLDSMNVLDALRRETFDRRGVSGEVAASNDRDARLEHRLRNMLQALDLILASTVEETISNHVRIHLKRAQAWVARAVAQLKIERDRSAK